MNDNGNNLFYKKDILRFIFIVGQAIPGNKFQVRIFEKKIANMLSTWDHSGRSGNFAGKSEVHRSEILQGDGRNSEDNGDNPP